MFDTFLSDYAPIEWQAVSLILKETALITQQTHQFWGIKKSVVVFFLSKFTCESESELLVSVLLHIFPPKVNIFCGKEIKIPL